jgi:hypothetical protein
MNFIPKHEIKRNIVMRTVERFKELRIKFNVNSDNNF